MLDMGVKGKGYIAAVSADALGRTLDANPQRALDCYESRGGKVDFYIIELSAYFNFIVRIGGKERRNEKSPERVGRVVVGSLGIGFYSDLARPSSACLGERLAWAGNREVHP